MSTIETVRGLTEPLLAGAGLELWDVELGKGVVRVLVDRDGGVDLDTLARAAEVVSGLLDDHPEIAPPGAYQLEVSSPGLERTLRTPEQYRRYVGTLVSTKTTAAVDGQRRWRGTLRAVDEEGVVILPDEDASAGGPGAPEPVRLRYDQIDRTRTVLVWGAVAAPPHKGRRNPPAGGPARRTDSQDRAGAGRAARSRAGVKGTS